MNTCNDLDGAHGIIIILLKKTNLKMLHTVRIHLHNNIETIKLYAEDRLVVASGSRCRVNGRGECGYKGVEERCVMIEHISVLVVVTRVCTSDKIT